MKRNSFKFKNNLPFKPMSKLSNQRLVIPLYHSLQDEKSLDFISPLYQLRSIETFEKDLEYFLKHFQPISLQDLIQLNKNKQKPKAPSFHITFDDGLSSFYEMAAPILEKKGIPATCFLNNEFIDNAELFYRYKVALLCQACSEKRKRANLETHIGRAGKDVLIKTFKSWTYADSDKIDESLLIAEIDVNEFLRKQKPYMTTEEIHSLIKKGFTFGAHSRKHIHYKHLSVDEQVEETSESTKGIKEKFNLDYAAFAFPFTDHGVEAQFFDRLKNKLDISFGTAGLKKKEYGFHHHRIIMEDNVLTAEQILKAEYLYYLLKAPFGKNSIKRT